MALPQVELRRRNKLKLIAAHGGKCLDCDLSFPPFVFDFDHRDPATKSFALSNKGTAIGYDRLLDESMKCDLVCANCHRRRTHKQRCSGCEYC